MKISSRSLDSSAHYETKSWLERIVILGMSQNPSQIVVTDKGNHAVHFIHNSLLHAVLNDGFESA